MELRPYQKECLEAIEKAGPGNWLIHMATGLGKTVTFASIPRNGKTLILSHRRELVYQPAKYFSCPVGFELGMEASHGEPVVSASVQTLSRRLDRFTPDDFDTIIWDEAHHAAAKSYREILNYFRPRRNIGFTATPNRADGVRMDDVFDDIIFSRDLRWGIKHGYLTDIYCRRVNIGYDLSGVSIRNGDYAPGELEKAMDGTADAITQSYYTMAKGATLIFAVSVGQAREIAERIPGAAVVSGKTPPNQRQAMIEKFTAGEIPCLVNCMVFTEGTDIPRVETVIIARPTKSDGLYSQMVGRGLRLYPGKERLNLIDCVGVSGTQQLCTAPSLLGLNLESIPKESSGELEGMLFDLPEIAKTLADCPQSWIKNVEIVDLWAKQNRYDTHGVNWFQQPDGSLTCSLPGYRLKIPAPDDLGKVHFENGKTVAMQYALDQAYARLCRDWKELQYIWDLKRAKRWGKSPASEKQKNLIGRFWKEFDTSGLTKLQASQVINRITGGIKPHA